MAAPESSKKTMAKQLWTATSKPEGIRRISIKVLKNNGTPWITTVVVPALAIDHAALQVPAAGGVPVHTLADSGESRLAFKVKSTKNDYYGCKPVFGFVKPGQTATIEVTLVACVNGAQRTEGRLPKAEPDTSKPLNDNCEFRAMFLSEVRSTNSTIRILYKGEIDCFDVVSTKALKLSRS
uniref:Major sperm protein n=1 Tax=Ditylenchus dipsaci TaxID=166011 RepID=A0A915DMN0_9BILA